MNDEHLRSIVLDTLKRVAPEAETNHLDPAGTFRDQFGIDSIDFLNFVLGLEERFGVRIAEQDYPQFSSLNGCLRCLRGYALSADGAPAG